MNTNQGSLLVIRCPSNPWREVGNELYRDTILLLTQEFAWCFSDDASVVGQSGISSIDSMPYADQVLVLLPSSDVRLIEVKVPLVSDKKLRMILPGLMEEYLLQGANDVQMQVLPPIPGVPALQRTVAILDRSWLAWLTQELSGLLSRQIRMVPDCYLLQPMHSNDIDARSTDLSWPSIGYEIKDKDIVWTVRLKEQIGASWVERIDEKELNVGELARQLPTHLRKEKIAAFKWVWLMEAAHQFIGKSAHIGVNLLPNTFRIKTRSDRVGNQANASGLSTHGAWTDSYKWRSSYRWFIACCLTLLIGSSLHLSWLVFEDWRWNRQMQLWVIPYLAPKSITALVAGHDQNTVLSTFIRHEIQNKRMQGLVSDADFSQMAAQLQRLNALYDGKMLDSLAYDGYTLKFQLKVSALEANWVTSAELVSKANSLGLEVFALGGNQFQLFPYAGLGVK